MAKYLFVYHGGGHPSNPAEVKKVMDAWAAWFGSMGSAVIDGGNPVGRSSTVKSDGSLVEAKGCPLLKVGGTIEIAPTMDM